MRLPLGSRNPIRGAIPIPPPAEELRGLRTPATLRPGLARRSRFQVCDTGRRSIHSLSSLEGAQRALCVCTRDKQAKLYIYSTRWGWKCQVSLYRIVSVWKDGIKALRSIPSRFRSQANIAAECFRRNLWRPCLKQALTYSAAHYTRFLGACASSRFHGPSVSIEARL